LPSNPLAVVISPSLAPLLPLTTTWALFLVASSCQKHGEEEARIVIIIPFYFRVLLTLLKEVIWCPCTWIQ